MTYAFCDAFDCVNHDGDGCTLDTIDLSRDNPEWVPDIAASVSCRDYERAEEGE